MFHLKIYLVFFFLVSSLFSQNFINQTILFDGNEREYELYIPSSYSENSLSPLMFNFHGGSDFTYDQIQQSDMRDLADENNFILVYPQAHPDPNDGGSTNWIHKGDTDHDDIYFIDALISELSAQYQIDLERVYACGYSLGGEFVYELLCRLSNKIAAGVVVARTMGQYQYETCSPQHPTPIMTILGTEDFYEGIEYMGEVIYISADETHQFWTEYNNTNYNPIEIEISDVNTNDGSTVTKRLWENGDACVSVVEYRVNGGGHEWPGYNGNMDINSDNEIWEFVSAFNVDGLISDCNLSLTNEEQNIIISPNPTRSIITINNLSDKSILNIIDLKGNIILESTIETGQSQVNISEYSPGIYILNIGGYSTKIIKK